MISHITDLFTSYHIQPPSRLWEKSKHTHAHRVPCRPCPTVQSKFLALFGVLIVFAEAALYRIPGAIMAQTHSVSPLYLNRFRHLPFCQLPKGLSYFRLYRRPVLERDTNG